MSGFNASSGVHNTMGKNGAHVQVSGNEYGLPAYNLLLGSDVLVRLSKALKAMRLILR